MNSLSNFQIPDVWEVKDVVNKLKNVVLNYTEMEAKVHEATNNEPWGASTTLMQELAQGTYNYQYFNEIMPTIYRRFTEKEPKQWRQIYKALVLLEYLIKNGSERVIDDARSHVSMIKVMRNFYYVDDRGKDEGLNVRNRAKEIVELLSNTDKIRAERKLAKKNRNKYIGVGSETGMRSMGGFSGGIGSSGSRYTGFGSDSYSGGGGLSFNGDAMSYGETPYPHQGNKYDEDEDEEGGYHSESNGSFGKEVYGFDSKKQTDDDDDWGDFTCGGAIEEPSTSNKIIDDDFADFQHAVPMEEPTASATTATTATTTTTTTTTTKQNKPQQQQDLFDLLDNDTPIVSTAANTTQPPLYMFDTKQPITPSGYHSQPQQSQPKPAEEEKKVSTPSTPTGMWAQASNFVSLDSLGKNTSNSMPAKGPSMNALKSNSVQADWNNWASNNSTPKPSPAPAATKTSSAFDDLLSL